MKKYSFVIFALVLSNCFAQEDSNATNQVSVLQRVGGFVYDYSVARGKYSIINAQDLMDTKMLCPLTQLMQGDYSWIFEYTNHVQISSMPDALRVKQECGALAATVLVSSETLPALVVIPESNLSVVNVRELIQGTNKPILLENRLVRQVLRAYAFSLGAGYSTYEAGVMQPVNTAPDLDRLSANFLPPDVVNSIVNNGAKVGFKPYRRTTYKRACKEGWAPFPSNEFQRAIFEQIKSEKNIKPSNPIKVTFDPDKAK